MSKETDTQEQMIANIKIQTAHSLTDDSLLSLAMINGEKIPICSVGRVYRL